MATVIRREQRSIVLVAHASEAEIEAFRQDCARLSYEVVSADSAREVPQVLFIGAGMAEAARASLAADAGIYALLATYDVAALAFDELLARCANVLIAPFEAASLRDCLTADEDGHPEIGANIIGGSPQVRELLRVMATVARFDAPILIKGETGTGKELVARGIHYSSARRDFPFVPVNCGALNDELLLAELFGYEKGAFTDAKRTHRGLVAQAAGGVLFLDEIDSLSPKAQAALLRFLQEQEYRPLGAETLQKSDVRVITATNCDLEALIAQRRFREDLYHRVHLLDVALPPLRARDGDVALLAEHFLAQLSQRYGVIKQLHPLTLQWMCEYAWPGNVRELQNYLYRLYVLSKGPIILVTEIKGNPVSLLGAPPRIKRGNARAELRAFREEKALALKEFERSYLHKVMQVTGGNISLAARHAGKERQAFRRLLKKHGIERASYGSHALVDE